MTGTILKYSGAKNIIADKIISLFPDGYQKMTYIEPFFGSGTVFFRKAPCTVETVNDICGDVHNLFLQIRENGNELARLIEHTPWSRQEYEESFIRTESDIENARRFLVRCWFAIGVKTYCRTGWRHNIAGNNGGIGTFDKLPSLIKEASHRLRPKAGNCVQIENNDAFALIQKYNRKNVLMYLDPPYVLNTRKNKKIYKHEMTDNDHIRLCELIQKSSAKIIMSGYANKIYEYYLQSWKTVGVPTCNEQGNRRMEILWTNYSSTKELFDFAEERS